jgi:hypothetical protein
LVTDIEHFLDLLWRWNHGQRIRHILSGIALMLDLILSAMLVAFSGIISVIKGRVMVCAPGGSEILPHVSFGLCMLSIDNSTDVITR